ncbi:MAG: flagellar basal body P-ring protein FlgI [Acidobacteriia bacterium]|nr:flagellar basal body P-ring protein FlgI [Terriglobia bacterium]
MTRFLRFNLLCATLAAAAIAGPPAIRLKELASLEGVRDNQLVGYGMVVGLNGTGDRRQTLFTAQSLANMLQQMGVTVNPQFILVRNTASAMVTATLPPFAQPGSRIDVSVAAIGDASSLQGGLLIMTSLRGIDGQVYSVAQGPVVTGGFIAGGAANTQVVNHPTLGRIPNGAIIERPSPAVAPSNPVRLQLHQADFTTAARIAEAVNQHYSAQTKPVARAENSGVVSIAIPPEFAARTTEFVAELEQLPVQTDRPARVVINERTGTIVMGKEVHVSPVAIMHGNLTVEIQTTFNVSQPAPFSQGATQVVPQVGVGVKEEKARNVVLKEGATVEELVRALSSIGSTPRDIIAILQSLRSAGALESEIEVI